MLDGPDTSSNMEKLEREVHRGAEPLVNVSLPPSSRFTSSILLRIYNDQGINYLTDFCRRFFFGYRLIWGTVAVPLGVFAIVQNLNIPLIIQPQVFGFLSIVSWSQVSRNLLLVYGSNN